MVDIVNLNRVRKAKARGEVQATAAANRIVHGRTKAEKQAAKAEAARRNRELDGAKREP
jgi:hypothetical protein